MLLASLRPLRPFLCPALLVLAPCADVGFGQIPRYVNGVTGNDVCYDGTAPVPTDLCTFPPPGSPVAGPFKTITRAAQSLGTSAGQFAILVAGVSSGGIPIVHNAALGESFPITVAASNTVVRYDAANSTPGVLVTVDASGTSAPAIFEFVAPAGTTFTTSAGIDGSTLGAGTQAIRLRGASNPGGGGVGIRVVADGPGAANLLTLRNVRISNDDVGGVGVHLLAQNGAFDNSARVHPTLDSCILTKDSAPGTTSATHLLVESNGYGWCSPTVFNCLFRVEPDASGVAPRMSHAIRMLGHPGSGNRVEGTYIANIVDGFSNVIPSPCGSGCINFAQGIGIGVLAECLSAATSAPTFTSCAFQNCGVTGFAGVASAGYFNPTFSNCNFLFNGKNFCCWDYFNETLNSLRGHGCGLALTGGFGTFVNADFQYCLLAGNFVNGSYVRVKGPINLSAPQQRVRYISCQAAYNLKEGIFLDSQRGSFEPWSTGGANILSTKVDHNGGPGFEAGLRMHRETSSNPPPFSPDFVVSNLLSFRNEGPGVLTQAFPAKFNFVTSARNGQEGIKAGFPAVGTEFEDVTARSNWDGTASPAGPNYDVSGLTDVDLRWSNIAGPPIADPPAQPVFPDSCTWPEPYTGGTDPNSKNLWCPPSFMNEGADDYHLFADEGQSRSLDTGKNSPIGGTPTTDLEGNNRITDFLLNGPNGNFPGNWADRGCYERPN